MQKFANKKDRKKEILQLINELSDDKDLKIGVGITTHNRNDMFKKSYKEIVKFLPNEAVLVVVDDCSTVPVQEADFRFDTNVGIAKAKNKCLELLYRGGCEHIFLFDDDTYPLVEDWWKPYVNSKEPHLNYIFTDFATGKKVGDIQVVYQNDEIVAYTHARGCMMYYDRVVLDKVGGFDEVFGKWGWEHPSFSGRIYNAGLTSFRYMDVVNSKGLIYSDDEWNENKNTSVPKNVRNELVNVNRELYNERKFSSDYVPFFKKDNVILTCYFTNIPDYQRNDTKWTPDVNQLRPLIESMEGKSSKLIVLHDCFNSNDNWNPEPDFDKKLSKLIAEDRVHFEYVDTSINPYFQRWISYRNYLSENADYINHVFCVDGTDVEVLKDPFWDDLGEWLYVGDEPTIVNCEWMRRTHKHPVLQEFIEQYADKQLLNAGLIGGRLDLVMQFIKELIDLYCTHLYDINAGDMGAFNYIAYKNYFNQLRYGRQVVTEFKKEERNNYSWFKHK